MTILSSIYNYLGKIIKSKITISIIVIIAICVGIYFKFFHHTTVYKFVTVQRGSITESVSLTGNTTPTQSVLLGFQNSGTIAHIYHNLGDKVNAGEVIAELNIESLSAALKQAQANVDAEQAKLDSLKAGSQPADIAVSQATLQKAQQDLANMYAGIGDTSIDSYAKANDAVRVQINQFFSAGDTNPKLTYPIANYQIEIDTESQRLSVGGTLNKWQSEMLSADQSNAGQETLLQDEISYLASIRALLNTVSATLDYATSLNSTTLSSYKTYVSTALTEVNTATKNLNTISQNIASQKSIVAQAQAGLTLKQAGATTEDIAAQQAQVEQAQAGVDGAQANLRNAEIIAPISGVITEQNAKIGQLATPGTPLISIIGNDGFEVDAGVSETDIGKINIGNKVTMTLDAFPNEKFSGSVFYIAPSETNVQGVISYQIKISFDKADPRLKSGLTANIDIETKSKDNVLILPQYGILQNDNGTFVETLVGKTVSTTPVTLGIQDQNGNVEVISGVSEAEQVINIGLKSQ